VKLDLESPATGPVTVAPLSNSPAVLQFLPDWLQVRRGEILRGDSLAIEFAPERLTGCRQNSRGAEVWDIEALVRFHPRGELVHGDLVEPTRTDGIVTALSPKRLEIKVPSDTTQIEMWFHNFVETGGRCDAWDSRFGENYWFDVAGVNPVVPQDAVRYRDGAIPSPAFVNTVDQTATKTNVFPRPPNGPPVGKDLRTFLDVRAWVKNIAFAKAVWIDVHVFDRGASLIQAATFGLAWEGSAGGAADLFRFSGEIYRGLTATPGSVSPRPNAWLVQYRLYYAVKGTMYTDAILHQLELVDDAVS
jgi:Family of unknown function (DUF6209)